MVARPEQSRWADKQIHWQPRLTKRSIGRRQRRCLDDIKYLGNRRFQISQDRKVWRNIKETYVQEWTIENS